MHSDDSSLLFYVWIMCRKDVLDRKDGTVCNGLKVVTRPRKVGKLNKLNVQHDDGAKYMSYIKVVSHGDIFS